MARGWDDRDPTEVRQPRTGGHGKGRGGKQDRSRAPRSVPNMDTDSGDPQMKVEFTILRGMVGAVIGRGGNTVQGIRNRTGATVHIHSAMPKEKETSVELNGTRKQIEDAYDELRAVMTTVDEEYTENHDAFSMASLELRTLPKMIGCLIGKAGTKIRSIEEASGAKVKVEPQQDGDEFQDVIIHGNIESVCKAHEMVQEALQSFDPTRAKTTRRTHTPQSGANNPQSMNVVDLSAQSLVGGNVGKNMVAPMLAQHQPAPIVIQAPAGGLASASSWDGRAREPGWL
ncbi:hypothetical protein BSKO_13993 [Bryopsis sp. KO-2023]|nr:hypothetical protein BSKO_13993 [Bryopsis sp. KO-2023]